MRVAPRTPATSRDGNTVTANRLPRRRHLPPDSEIRVEDDTVIRLACAKTGYRLVDPAHGEMLDLRRHPVAGGKAEHGIDSRARTGRRGRHRLLAGEQRHHRDRDRLEYRADEMQAALRRQQTEDGVPVERRIRRDEDEIELPGSVRHCCGI